MEIRAATSKDFAGVAEIDATIESLRYLHVDRSGTGLNMQWKVEERPLRERLIQPAPMDDEQQFIFRQITSGIDDGVALVVEYDDAIVGSLLAQPIATLEVLRVIHLRVDFDIRRQGIGTALLFHAIQSARDAKHRAVTMETLASNHPAAKLLDKLGFQLAGLDTHRKSNHDLVKEAVTLVWYAVVD